MQQTVQLLTNVLLTIMLWATGLGLGMQFTIPQILAPLKRPTLVLIAIVVNIILLPLITWGLTLLFPVDAGYATGILLTTFSMAAPLGLKFVLGAKGSVPYAIALVVLLQVLNVISIPFWSALLLPGNVTINPFQVVGTLLFDVLFPLAIGLFIKARYDAHAREWYPGLARVSTWALILVIVLTIAADLPVLLSLIGSFALLVSVLMFAIAFLLGYLLGGRQEMEKRTSALITATRAVGPALLIANQAFPTQPKVIAGATAVGVIVTVLPMFIMMEWGKHLPAAETTMAPSAEARAGD